jgi:hypothetical protein
LFTGNSTETVLPFNRGDIYIFDENNLFVTKYIIETESYDLLSRGLEFESELPVGNYKAIGWAYRMRDANSHIPYTITIPEFIVGETSLSDIYVSMSSATRSHTDGVICGIYCSDVVTFKTTNSDTVIVDLEYMRLTKDIDINVKFINSDGSPNLELMQGVKASINCWDGVLNFDGSVINSPSNITYRPYDASSIEEGVLHKKYRKMTLAKKTTKPTVDVIKDGKSLYNNELFTLLEGTNYPTQEALDMTNHYKIDIVIKGTEDKNEVNIWINGWKYIPINEGV